MSEKEEFNELSKYEKSGKPKANEVYQRWVWGVVLGDAAALIILAVLAVLTDNWKEAATVIVTGLVGIASVNGVFLQVLVAGQMTKIMDRQEAEMTLQRQTAQKQWETMQAQEARMIEQREIMERQANISAAQSSMMGKALTEARKANEQSERIFSLTERPLVGIEQVYWEPQKNGENRVVFVITNSGKTMAKITNLSISFQPRSLFFESVQDIPEDMSVYPLEEDSVQEGYITSGIIHNGGRKVIRYATVRIPTWDNIREGDVMIYVWMRIEYTGINGGDGHFTEYRAYYNHALDGFIECSDRNDAN